MHGASIPTIIASPLRVCDIEFQPNEVINEIVIGDSSRWLLEKGSVGNITHLFVKPAEVNLETNAIITTNRRVYHLRFISKNENFTPYIGFAYPNEIMAYMRSQDAQAEHNRIFSSINPNGTTSPSPSTTTSFFPSSHSSSRSQSSVSNDGRIDIADINFEYTINGKVKWKPERIYDDGVQTFIRFPKVSELPVLFVKKSDENILVNYRMKNKTMVVDGIFDEFVLLMGVGGDREEVNILRD